MVLIKYLFFSIFVMLQTAFGEEFYVSPKAFLDVSSGKWIHDKKILIKNGKIVSVDNKRNPSKIKTLELPDNYALPGLIDSHAHVFFTQTKTDKDLEHALKREACLSDQFRVERAKKFLQQYIKEGFTTIFDLGNSGQFLDVLLRDEIKNDPLYPLMFVSGPGITNYKGQFAKSTDLTIVKREYSLVSEKAVDWTNLLSFYHKKNVDILKIYLDNEPSEGGLKELDIKSLFANPLAKKFKKITGHAIFEASMAKVIKTEIAHIEHASEFAIDHRLKNRSITVTGIDKETLQEFGYYNKAIYQYQVNGVRKLIQQGNVLLFGPDFYFHVESKKFSRAKKVKEAISFFKEAGATNLDILKAMTINPAKSIGFEKNLGAIKRGAWANMIFLKKDPLNDLNALKEISLIINKGQVLSFLGESK